MNEMNESLITVEFVMSKIYEIRGMKVMLDRDLAEMYGVETRRLNEQVRRNLARFPLDFMFQLTELEFENLMSQIATSSWGGTRKMPYVFTEQGVAMLSGVLNSDRAISVNIHIMRVYTKMRELMLTHKDILLKMEDLERQIVGQDEKVKIIFAYLKQFVQLQEKERTKIGYGTNL